MNAHLWECESAATSCSIGIGLSRSSSSEAIPIFELDAIAIVEMSYLFRPKYWLILVSVVILYVVKYIGLFMSQIMK